MIFQDVIILTAIIKRRILPDWVRIRVITSDGGDHPSRLLALSDCHLVVALRQDRTLVHIVNINRNCGCGCWAVSATDQSHWVLSAEHQDVFTFSLKVQHLCKKKKKQFCEILKMNELSIMKSSLIKQLKCPRCCFLQVRKCFIHFRELVLQ